MSVFGAHGLRLRELYSISRNRGLLLYSAAAAAAAAAQGKSQTHFMVDYLINSLGFSREEAISASTKVTHFKSTINPDSVINFFKHNGLDKTQIRNIISSSPTLLSSNVEKTLKPKLEFLQDLGLSGSDLAKVIVGDSSLFRRGLNTFMKPTIHYLKEFLGSEKDVVNVLRRSMWLLSCNAPRRMPPNVLLLKESGWSSEKIKKFFILKSRYLMQKPGKFEEVLYRVEVELGISRDSPMFFHGLYVVASNSKSTIETKFGIFRSFGWTNSDIDAMICKSPYVLCISEAKIRKGLKFFMNDLGFSPEYLASHSRLLTYNLEKRIVSRNEVLKILKEKKLLRSKASLYLAVSLSEPKFVQYYLLPFKDEVPKLYEDYMKRMEQ